MSACLPDCLFVCLQLVYNNLRGPLHFADLVFLFRSQYAMSAYLFACLELVHNN